MLYMKEDDMDEMLRKAAENYEVDADKAADWNAVYKCCLHETEETNLLKRKKETPLCILVAITYSSRMDSQY